MSSLILSVSPEKVERPYYFYITKIKVYSLEELYYHCYHYWRESIDDFIMGKLEDWIKNELGLISISGQIVKIKDQYSSITDQYINFLKLIDYFYESELELLRKEIFKWENKAEWEKCKEKADYFMKQNKPEEALKWYKKAIVFDENEKIYNNMGVAFMRLGLYEDATYFFTKANEKKPNYIPILLNLVEVNMLRKNYEEAGRYLNQAAMIEDSKTIWYYYGELYNHKGMEEEAVESYKRAIDKGDDFKSYISLAKFYVRKKEYDKAKECLDKIPASSRNEVFWLEYAKLYEILEKKNLIFEYIKKSIEKNPKYIYAWIALARFYRKDKNFEKAYEAIYKAFRIDDENDEAKLELAKIQKEEGNKKEYKFSIKQLIKKWIHRYRRGSM
ncbi:tetratricopeptide repeat protein [Defluviitalea phaphyphila]|uniref:tetratricopeptide repeat protein n=1 Tax=Defluviitalea phaphyphila TaxID=1473580 RepID=UPI00073075E5|nr:tetratricopeptide repeat protein [Defluviitalea phaphyphila]